MSDIPAILIAKLCHAPDLGVLEREGFFVPGASTAVDIPAIEHSVVLKVHPAFVVDERAEFFKAVLFQLGSIVGQFRGLDLEQLFDRQFCDRRIARFVQVAAIDRVLQRGFLAKELERRSKQIDEC